MRFSICCLLLGFVFAACSDAGHDTKVDRSKSFDGIVSFTVASSEAADSDRVTTKKATVFLDVAKEGRKPLVDAWAAEASTDERYGRHNFPPYCTSKTIVAYYAVVLGNAGWKEGIDFQVNEDHISFFGVRRLNSGSDNDEIRVSIDRS